MPDSDRGCERILRPLDRGQEAAELPGYNPRTSAIALCSQAPQASAEEGPRLVDCQEDVSNCFYLFEVSEDRLVRQTLGPRIPRSWLDDIEDHEHDIADEFEAWHSADLRLSAGAPGDILDASQF